jgi:ribonuclease-3
MDNYKIREGIVIMNPQDIKRIENIIQYEFKNKKLLEEAFIIVAEPDNYACSSEVFRIPGKRAINFALTQIVMERFGEMGEDGYSLITDKESVNYILNNLYTRDVYARNIQMLGLAEYLKIPEGDVYDDMTRRLFEALVGAVTIESNWDLSSITAFVGLLLDSDFYIEYGFEDYDKHYVAKIYNWCVENNKSFLVYRFQIENGKPVCKVKFGPSIVTGNGKNSKTLAKFDAAKQVYQMLVDGVYILERDSEGYIIGDLKMSLDEAVAYLDSQYQNGAIGEITYSSAVDSEKGYIGVCTIESDTFTASADDLDEMVAMKKAAYKMVKHLLGYRVEE